MKITNKHFLIIFLILLLIIFAIFTIFIFFTWFLEKRISGKIFINNDDFSIIIPKNYESFLKYKKNINIEINNEIIFLKLIRKTNEKNLTFLKIDPSQEIQKILIKNLNKNITLILKDIPIYEFFINFR